MQPLEKVAVPAGSRRNLHVAVFMRKGWQPAIFVLTGSSYPSMQPLKEYAKDDGTMYERLAAQEYIDCLERAYHQLTKRGESVNVALLHDKATPHTARATKGWAEQNKLGPLHVKQLPTDSPDPHILDVPLRLKACISSNGWHIDNALKKLKQERKAAQPVAGKRQIVQPQKARSAGKKAKTQ